MVASGSATNEASSADDYAFSALHGSQGFQDHWYADSGASRHMTDNRSLFTTFKPIEKGTKRISGVGDKVLEAAGVGDIRVTTKVGDKRINVTVKDVLYVPHVGSNLLSIGVATDQGMKDRIRSFTKMERRARLTNGSERVGEKRPRT